MTTNNKFLYFNTTATDTDADGGVQDAAITIPASSIVAFDVRANNQIMVMTKEAVQTDTTDVALSKPTTVDPRVIIEEVVNEINFSKDAMLVVADDNTSEYIHDDIDGIDGITTATYSNPTISLGSRVKSFISGANAGGGGISVQQSNVGEFNSEVITTIFIDLAQSGLESSGSTDEHDVIGRAGVADAYLTKITESINGIVYRGEMICVEEPTGASAAIGLAHNGSATLSQNDLIAGSHIIDDVTQTLGKRISFTANIAENRYLYLFHGASGSATTYTAGKFLIRLFGAKATGL